MKTLAEELKERLENTPKTQLEREWKEICDLGFKGPSVKEFLKVSSPVYMLNIDWGQLQNQKQALLSVIEHIDSYNDELTGIVNLIDSLQDYAVDVLGISEDEVFNLNEE